MMRKISSAQMMLRLFMRDIRLANRRKSDTLGALIFFTLVVSLFPLAIGSEVDLLRQIAPGIIWVCALLAGMLSMNRLFMDDYAEGVLEQLLFSPCPLELLVLSKILAHWVTTGLILLMLSPLLALQFNLSPEAMLVLWITLLIGTPILSCIGAIGASLTLGQRGSGALISLITLPLLIPILILGTLAVDAAASNMPFTLYLYLLLALATLTVFFAPIASAAGLRITLE